MNLNNSSNNNSQNNQSNQNFPNPSSHANSRNVPASGAPDAASKNILGKDVEIKGTIRFDGEILICDCKVEGEINSDKGALVLGKNAEVTGNIRTRSVTVHGRVVGNIAVTGCCELKTTAVLEGDLDAQMLTIEPGATFMGRSQVTPNKGHTTTNTAKTEKPATVADISRKQQPVVTSA